MIQNRCQAVGVGGATGTAVIFVSGGRGFIGTNLTQELRLSHHVWTCDIKDGIDTQHIRADVGSDVANLPRPGV